MKINDSDLFFTCSLIELIGRSTKQKRSAVVALLGEKIRSHIYSNAGVLHCEPIAKNADAFIEICNIPEGTFDNVADCKYEVPDYWTIGKVFARLIEDVASGNAIETLQEVYSSPVCDAISNYNSDFFYQPRGFIKEFYLDECKNSPKKRKTPALRFAGFTDAWEQREFFSFVQRRSEISDEAALPRIEYEDIIPDQGILNKDIFQKESMKKGIKFSKGDVLFGKLRPYLKNWFLPYFSGLAVGDFWVLYAKQGDSAFLYYLLQTPEFFLISNQSSGSKMPRADWSLVSQYKFSFPSAKTEQEKIGQFFKSLDCLITLHQREQIFDEL